jgi:hypothetical protein
MYRGILEGMKACRFVLGLFLLGYFGPPSHAAVLDINYTISDSTIGDGNASGTIRDGTTQIGTWTVTSFSFTRLDTAVSWTPFIETIASNRTDNSYGGAGVGIRMIGNGMKEDGVSSFRYTLGYSLTSAALSGGYSVASVAFWGKFPGTVQNYGPAFSTGTGGQITLSGFSGFAQVSDPNNNLQAADGQQFLSGTLLSGWNPGGNAIDEDWSAATVQWSLIAPDSASLTYLVDYRGQTFSAANEATAFNINIIPEPSVGSLFLLGAAWALRRSRKI